MANLLLAMSGEEMKVSSSGEDDEVVAHLPADVPHFSVLSRTVSGVIGAALSASLQEKKVFWVGGIEGYKTEELEDLYWFSADMPERMQSFRLRQDYRDFEEYCSIAKATQDVELNQAIRLLDEYFPLPQKLAIMRRQVVTHEKDAHVTVSTAHRSKGLEWDVGRAGRRYQNMPQGVIESIIREHRKWWMRDTGSIFLGLMSLSLPCWTQ